MRESEEETESSVSNVYDWREEGVEEAVRARDQARDGSSHNARVLIASLDTRPILVSMGLWCFNCIFDYVDFHHWADPSSAIIAREDTTGCVPVKADTRYPIERIEPPSFSKKEN